LDRADRGRSSSRRGFSSDALIVDPNQTRWEHLFSPRFPITVPPKHPNNIAHAWTANDYVVSYPLPFRYVGFLTFWRANHRLDNPVRKNNDIGVY
jgi:hypothetical protein